MEDAAPRIETPATRLLGIGVPIVQAGMSWGSSDWRLPLAVSRAGGLGVIAAGPMRLPDLKRAIELVRAETDAPFAVNLPLYRKGAEDVVELLLEMRPPVLIASQGGPRRHINRFQDIGTTWLHVVAGTEHAMKAVDAGVDGLIAVGAEAGGHPPPSGVSSLVMTRAIAKAVSGVPIIASGGFVDGAGLAAALALGAHAVQFGTRFLASTEANVHPAYKQAILAAEIEDSRTVGVDLGVIRVLANDFTARMSGLEAAGASLEDRRAAFTSSSLRMAALDGDMADGKIEAGQASGLIDSIVDAEKIVRQILDEYRAAVGDLPPARQPARI